MRKKRLVCGILAHVDAGKTTLSEAMLYHGGVLRKLGRVDHRDAFLDTDAQEKERGITIFSKQAELEWNDTDITLLDTPGHVDFSSETERTLAVLDFAILVVSGPDGVQGHTATLWRLLKRYHVPVFVFVNKMDRDGVDRSGIMAELERKLGGGFVDMVSDDAYEQIAMLDEDAMERYLEAGEMSDAEITRLIAERKLFLCYFGSALRLDGVDALMDGFTRYAPVYEYPCEFAARVYKITHDPSGARLTHMKITGGSLKVKTVLTNRRDGISDDEVWEEKVNQIRIYSGDKYTTKDEVCAGEVCAVTGLTAAKAGDGLGGEPDAGSPALEPVFTYRVIPENKNDPHTALQILRRIEEEDPQLHVIWNETLREIYVQLMGEVQLEILKRVLSDRFGLEVRFDEGSILYKETIVSPVEGIGHYEPLRHYAEVHLLLEPGERGSGLRFYSSCPEDVLDRNWQRLILTHLAEKEHVGVLTGSPITDMKITLITGRAHLKHTEGGDFRQATYRAVRQGLMSAESVLLEPWYDVLLELPSECVGRAMTDIQRMGGGVEIRETDGEESVLTAAASVAELRHYAREVAAYTKGRGSISCTLRGYEPCRDADSVITAIGYDPERDTENPADSVFCSHGAGFVVKWSEVQSYMHLEGLDLGDDDGGEQENKSAAPSQSYRGSFEQDRELQSIFERTYGPVKRRNFIMRTPKERHGAELAEKVEIKPAEGTGPEYVLVDGYNIIFAWDDLKAIASENLDAARQILMDIMCNYQGFTNCVLILVFDAYRVQGNPGVVTKYHNIHVVYTKEAETADTYIEKATYEIAKRKRVRVATSDRVEQLIILGHGAQALSALSFRAEVEAVTGRITDILQKTRESVCRTSLKDALKDGEKTGRGSGLDEP